MLSFACCQIIALYYVLNLHHQAGTAVVARTTSTMTMLLFRGRTFCLPVQSAARLGGFRNFSRALAGWNKSTTLSFPPPSVKFGSKHVLTSATQDRFLSTVAAAKNAAPSNATLQLYQYSICPFCNRVKALLDFASIPYTTTEVNPLTKAEIKPWKTLHSKVPIALIDEVPVFESDTIIENLLDRPSIQKTLEDLLRDQMSVESFRNGPAVKQWTDFATNELAVLLYPNMCRSWGDSYRAFDYVNHTQSFGVMQRILIQNLGSLAMYMAASKVKKRRNITDERQALEDVLKVLEKALEGNFFLSGKKLPNLGDLYVYGTLRAIRGLPVYEELVDERGGPIFEWCERMETQLAK